MITTYKIDSRGFLVKSDKPISEAAWIDVVMPTPEEYALLEGEIDVRLPQHHEMLQIEYSSRFYEEENALCLSAFVIAKVAPIPDSHAISLIVTANKLVTMRFFELNPYKSFIQQLTLHPRSPSDHFDILILLLDALAGRVADIFETFEEKTELLGFGLNGAMHGIKRTKNSTLLNETLHEIIELENLLSKCYQSLSSLQLLVGFFQQGYEKHFKDNISNRLVTLKQDIKGMIKHGEFLNQKLEFQLESTLGLINIEQTHIIKTFTVLAMIFMPPTLIASIYGMNFRYIPELNLHFGYPLAMGIMIVSSVFPYLFFKRKGWL